MYRGQLSLFDRSIRKKFQLHFENTATRFALIAAFASDYRNSGALSEIFLISRAAVDDFLYFIDSPNLHWRPALNDLLQDPQGSFFVDDDQYTDIALHMVKYMSEYVPLT